MNTKKYISIVSGIAVKTLFALALVFTIAATVGSEAVVAAPEPGQGGEVRNCDGVKTAFNFNCNSNTNPIVSFLLIILNFLAVGVGITVVLGIVWGSFMYATSGGNANQSKQGVNYILNAVIGLILFIFMYAIVNFFVPGGAFR